MYVYYNSTYRYVSCKGYAMGHVECVVILEALKPSNVGGG